MSNVLTSYHACAFEHKKRERAVRRVMRRLDKYPLSVGVACTGLSGILVGVMVADATKRPFAIVRKEVEKSHAIYQVEGYRFKEYVIVDDFIDSGNTIRRIVTMMKERTPESVCRGILLYNCHGKSRDHTHIDDIPVTYCAR